jgi:hypothetical protein
MAEWERAPMAEWERVPRWPNGSACPDGQLGARAPMAG